METDDFVFLFVMQTKLSPEALADFGLNDSGDRLAPFEVALF